MKLNKPLIRKMIKRIEAIPEAFDQADFAGRWAEGEDRPKPPCGTVACLAGEAVICAAPNAKVGLRRLFRLPYYRIPMRAEQLLGLSRSTAFGDLFDGYADGWPQPFRSQFRSAKTYKGQARAAVNLLKAILRTDGKILEGQ